MTMTYAVGGNMDKGLDKLAPIVDAVSKEQFNRLKVFVETWAPVEKK